MPGSRAGRKPVGPVAEMIGRGQLQPFVAPPCARCGARLCDANGNPRWEVVGQLTFVCLGGCPSGVQRRARKAVLA